MIVESDVYMLIRENPPGVIYAAPSTNQSEAWKNACEVMGTGVTRQYLKKLGWKVAKVTIVNNPTKLLERTVESLRKLLDDHDSDVRSEYEGTTKLESQLAYADHAREVLKEWDNAS